MGPGGPICRPGEGGRGDDDEDDDEGGGQKCQTLGGGARLFGDGVGFYFTGKVPQKSGRTSVMRFEPASVVELAAPTDGPLAGLLFIEDRAADPLRYFEVLSVDARKLVGTIYLRNGRLLVNTDEPVSDESAYTAIVARRLELIGSPNLFLNTDYDDTDVPVPTGLGTSTTSHLSK